MGTKKNGLELYLHIPFCIKKCDYCDFLSGPSTRAGQEAYIYALLREMETVSKNLKKRPVDTVFIGGGTPSVPECDVMEKLLQGLRDYFLFSADAEVTIEANPGTLTPEKLSIYRNTELTGSALAYSRQTIRNWLCLEEFIIMHSFWKAFRWQERLAFPI